MTKSPAVQSSGASLSAPSGTASGGGHASGNRALVARAASSSRLGSRTIVETAACPQELKHGEQPWSFTDFKVQKMLGEGSMSSVVHCVCARSGVHAAVKMYHRDRMNGMNVKQVSREIEIHASMLHPNIVRLYAAFEDADGIYLVQEYAPRGDLYVELSRRGGYMAEAHVVKNVLIPFLSALTYMHTQGILHRDIKPENIMLGADGEVKVGDFGLAINTTREKPMSRVGTLDYMPPEIVRLPYSGAGAAPAPGAQPPAPGCAAYGLPADVWCVGVLAYELLLGSPPFEAESKQATYTRILKLEPSLPSHLSDQARDFIRAALNKDPACRPSVHQLLRHPWLRAYQRPKSMVVLEAPSKERAAGGGSASPTSSAVAIAADTAVAAAAAEAAVAAAKGAAAKGAAAAVTATQLASHSEEQGEVVSPDAASFSAPPTCTPAGGAARPALISKSLSFSSTMAGRFSAVKPSKPTPFSMLARYKSGSAGSSSSGNADGRTEMAACSSSALAAAAAMAEMEAEASASVDPASAAGKPADERLVIRVQATAGSAAVAAAASAWPPTPVNTPSAASKAAAPLATAADDLIRAALPNGNAVSTPRSTTDSSGHNGARSSFAAVIKRKLSSAGSKGFSLFAPSAALDGSKDEGSAVAIAAAVAAANGRSRATGKGVGTIAAVQAPSMQQLLAPVAGGRPATPTSGSRLASLVRFGRKKHSLASASAMQVAAAAGADGADAGSAPVQP